MRRNIAVIVIIAAWATIGLASDLRTLTDTMSAEGIDLISIEAGVGSLDIEAGSDDDISIEIVLKPRRGGFFSSMKRAQEEVDAARIESEVVGGKLYLEVYSESGDRRFEERWALRVPARLAAEAELGVGDISVIDIEGGVEIDVGVGEVEVEVASGDIVVELGVGDVEVIAPAASYGHVEVAAGVGDADIRVDGENVVDGGFVGHSGSWTGTGEFQIEVEVGVGDVEVELE